MELKEFKIQVLPLREKIGGLAKKLLDNAADADDVVQEVMMKLWDRRQQLDDCRNVEAFVMTMTHHTCIDMVRMRKYAMSQSEDIQIADMENSAEKLFELKDEVEIIRHIIETLPELQRITIRMKDVEGYENKEIAEITGSNVEVVRSNLSRARKKVRDIYLMTIKKRN
jgi:RNA polymerase sigma-70 factor (ECF subfamily)